MAVLGEPGGVPSQTAGRTTSMRTIRARKLQEDVAARTRRAALREVLQTRAQDTDPQRRPQGRACEHAFGADRAGPLPDNLPVTSRAPAPAEGDNMRRIEVLRLSLTRKSQNMLISSAFPMGRGGFEPPTDGLFGRACLLEDLE